VQGLARNLQLAPGWHCVAVGDETSGLG